MAETIHILLAEDEPSLGQIVKESLETQGYQVSLCKDGQQALEVFQKDAPDILVLDVMMPKKDGFTLARDIRKHNTQVPILFLTAKSQTQDVVEGFQLGGNDYLKKPFSMEELIVRIQNLLRSNQLQENTAVALGNYSFHFKKQWLQFQDEKPLSLTHREAHLLFHLYHHRNTILDRSVILKKLWNDDDFFSARSMDVFITKLRKKLKKDPNIQIINVRGYGYKLVC
ncbi:MAG TPA: response regulator transcription factor [Flavobacteriaceae bacterium]|nr:response regulator transcription factor [Flavobacteriaceae bacterium]HPF12008.1 response regulator transcription factor [Flavobacteriaceae bacterium]HQU21413.1 response regulator transcription factor [Flavobacteriaceae bacterium]HQU65157.1 response regulator transcription factor [Flavobacteriaceae bacterium]HRW45308.1 response regulator transcription factor [Flavobacteriaceae bacterium]